MTGKGWSECSPEEREELVNDACRKGELLMQRLKNRLTCHNLRLAERYLDGELKLHVHMRRINDPAEYCTVLYGTREAYDFNPWGDRCIRNLEPSERGFALDSDSAHSTICDDQSPVLVLTVQAMKRPQWIIPSVVWFDTSESVHNGLAPGLFMGQKVPIKTIGRSEYGEVAALTPSAASGEHHQFPQVIKGALQIMDGIASDCPEPLGRASSNADTIDQMPRIGVVVTQDAIRVTLIEGFDLGFKIVDVFFGPFDLDPNAGRKLNHAS